MRWTSSVPCAATTNASFSSLLRSSKYASFERAILVFVEHRRNFERIFNYLSIFPRCLPCVQKNSICAAVHKLTMSPPTRGEVLTILDQGRPKYGWRWMPSEDALRAQALDHLRELLELHWKEARDSADDDGKFAIGFKVAVADGMPAKLKVTSRISTTATDEIESNVDDPSQPRLL